MWEDFTTWLSRTPRHQYLGLGQYFAQERTFYSNAFFVVVVFEGNEEVILLQEIMKKEKLEKEQLTGFV